MPDLKGKKLLFLGGFAMMMEPVQYAKSQGVHTIVTDYYDDGPAKRVADESWTISTADVEALCVACKREGIEGVFASFDDFNIQMASIISEAMGFPYYATSSLVENTMNKAVFKENCVRFGVPTMKRFEREDVERGNVEFPIIVKPVDGSGSRGITVCKRFEDVAPAIEHALRISKSGELIIESYVEGDEIGVNYILQDGRIAMTAMHDRHLQVEGMSLVKLPLAYVYPSKYTDVYLECEDASVIGMLNGIGLQNGSIFMQGCVANNVVNFYEAGYRLNGAKQYHIIENECGFNSMHCLVEHSLTGKMSQDDIVAKANPRFSSFYCTLSLLVKPGVIEKVVGLAEIAETPSTLSVTQWCFPGDVLDESVLGTQKQIGARVTIRETSLENLAARIERVNELYQVLSPAGEDMRLESFDPNELFS